MGMFSPAGIGYITEQFPTTTWALKKRHGWTFSGIGLTLILKHKHKFKLPSEERLSSMQTGKGGFRRYSRMTILEDDPPALYRLGMEVE